MKLAATFVACLVTGANGQAGIVSDIPDAVCADIAVDSSTGQPDGRVGVDDLLVVLGNFRRTGNNAGDLNGDQVVDVEDLLGLLAQFHSTCVSEIIVDNPSDGFDTDQGSTQDLEIRVANDFVDALASQDALADCYINPEEMAQNAAMTAMLAAFQETQAASLGNGITAADIIIDGIYTDGDDVAGCSHAIGQDIAVSLASTFIDTLTHDQGCGANEMPGQHTCGGWSDCTLNVAEMANDPEAVLLIQAVVQAQCAALGLPPRPANPEPNGVYCEDVVEVDGISLEGCTPDACVVPAGAPANFCSGRRRAQTHDHVVAHVVKQDFGIVKFHVAQ